MNKEANSNSLNVRKDILKDSKKPTGGEADDLALKKLNESWIQIGACPASPALFKQRQSNFDQKIEPSAVVGKQQGILPKEIDSHGASKNIKNLGRQQQRGTEPSNSLFANKSAPEKNFLNGCKPQTSALVNEASKIQGENKAGLLGEECSSSGKEISGEEDVTVLSGKTKGLVGFWKNQNDDVKNVKKKVISSIDDDTVEIQDLSGAKDLPQKNSLTSQIQKPLQKTQNQTMNSSKSNNDKSSKTSETVLSAPISSKTPANLSPQNKAIPPFKIDQRQKDSTAKTTQSKDILTKENPVVSGHIQVGVGPKGNQIVDNKNQSNQSETSSDLDLVKSSSVIVLAENEPQVQDPNIARCQGQQADEIANEVNSLQPGKTQNLLKLFKEVESDQLGPKASTSKFKDQKPSWILEIEEARGGPGWNGQVDTTADVPQPKPWENDLLKNKPKNVPKTENLEAKPTNMSADNSSIKSTSPPSNSQFTKKKKVPTATLR